VAGPAHQPNRQHDCDHGQVLDLTHKPQAINEAAPLNSTISAGINCIAGAARIHFMLLPLINSDEETHTFSMNSCEFLHAVLT
jgi:hypothetical protein